MACFRTDKNRWIISYKSKVHLVASAVARSAAWHSLPHPVRQRLSAVLNKVSPAWQKRMSGFPVEEVDLRRTLIGGEAWLEAQSWAEVSGDLKRTSTLLADSHYVQFLQQYKTVGEKIFDSEYLERTLYYKNAMQVIQYLGSYYQDCTHAGVLAQARAFITLLERMERGDPSEVQYPPTSRGHSPPGSLPIVQRTLTANTFQIYEGHHRLAINWFLEQHRAKAVVLPPKPTGLQSLILSVAQSKGCRQLCQPIDSPEVDEGWVVFRRCDDLLEVMLDFLKTRGYRMDRLSFVDLGCSYGWFVAEFAKRVCWAIGVEPDPAAVRVGQIAYGLNREQLIQSDLQTFLVRCNRNFDLGLLSVGLDKLSLWTEAYILQEIFKRVDLLIRSCLFIITDENLDNQRFSRRNYEVIDSFVRKNTSFNHIVPLYAKSKHARSVSNNYGSTVLACMRW